nr:hypothetical protein [Tanacetum cinerariifolium]
MKDPGLFILPCRLGDFEHFDTLADLGSCVNLIPLYLFKKLKISLLKEIENVLGLADGTKSYPIGIVRDVERIFSTAIAVIDCKKSKIAVGEGITRSIFGVRYVGHGQQDVPYWTTIARWKSYNLRPNTNNIGAQPPYCLEKDFKDKHVLREWEIARDAEINPFRDVLVFRKIVQFLGAIPINFKGNMWESKDIIDKKID